MRGTVTFPLLSPSTLIVQHTFSDEGLGQPREIAINDPIALPLDRLKEVVLVGCIPDVTAIPEWDQCDMSSLRGLESVEGVRVVVDLTELESTDRGKTEDVLGWFDWKTLGGRVELLMRDEEEKTAVETLLKKLGWRERLKEGKLVARTRLNARTVS